MALCLLLEIYIWFFHCNVWYTLHICYRSNGMNFLYIAAAHIGTNSQQLDLADTGCEVHTLICTPSYSYKAC